MHFRVTNNNNVHKSLCLLIALHHAAQANNNLSMKVLVESGAQLHLVNKDVSVMSVFLLINNRHVKVR